MTPGRQVALWSTLGACLMACELAVAQQPGGAIVGHARDATTALTIVGPWIAFLLSLFALRGMDAERRRLLAVLASNDASHQIELAARRAEHLEDLRRFTGETQILAGRIVEERERTVARFARLEQLVEDIRDRLNNR